MTAPPQKTPEQEIEALLATSACGCQRVVKLVGSEALYVDRHGKARTAYLVRDGDDLKVDATVSGFPA